MRPCTTMAVVVLCVVWAGSCGQQSVAEAQLEAGDPAKLFELEAWAQDVPEVTDLAFLSDGRAVITGKGGDIVVVTAGGKVQKKGQSIAVDKDSEKGLLGVVRDDQDRLYFYASAGPSNADKHKVFRATIDPSGTIKVDTSKSIIGNGLEGPANHDGGGMVIHKGQLYVGVGDTGANASPPQNKYGTCLNKGNGKILRVNLDGSIPDDNPLTKLSQVTGCASTGAAFAMMPPDKRIYAWGLRNPWRFWIDPKTDLLWIGDVGELTQEEITVGGKGAHHGWPFNEGTHKHGALGGLADCKAVTPSSACVAPQHGYPRSDGTSVTGGLIPTAGCGWGAYENRYFFGDWGTGAIWTLDVKADRSGAVASSRKAFANVGQAVTFRMGPDGAMYIGSHAWGTVQRLAPKSIPASCKSGAGGAAAPARDSGTGTGTDGGKGAPAAPSKGGNKGGSAAAASDGCDCALVGIDNGRAAGWTGGAAGVCWLAVRTRTRRRTA